MAIIVRDRGLLFIQSPRTGCTAIADGVLRPELGGEFLPLFDVLDERGTELVDRKHCTVPQLRQFGLLREEDLDDLLVFVNVRNPFDSMVSLYEKIVRKYAPRLRDPDPDDWLSRKPNTEHMFVAIEDGFDAWIAHQFAARVDEEPTHLHAGHLEGVDEVVRFEHLQQDLDRVLAKAGIDPIAIPVINRTARTDDHRAYYSAESRELVAHVFGRDLDRFGYSF